MEAATITIKGKEYRFRYSLRSIMAFEQLSGMMSAEILTATAKVLLSYYACIFAYNEDTLPFEEFIEEMDGDVTLFREVAAEFDVQSRAFNAAVKSDGDEGKKKA